MMDRQVDSFVTVTYRFPRDNSEKVYSITECKDFPIIHHCDPKCLLKPALFLFFTLHLLHKILKFTVLNLV